MHLMLSMRCVCALLCTLSPFTNHTARVGQITTQQRTLNVLHYIECSATYNRYVIVVASVITSPQRPKVVKGGRTCLRGGDRTSPFIKVVRLIVLVVTSNTYIDASYVVDVYMYKRFQLMLLYILARFTRSGEGVPSGPRIIQPQINKVPPVPPI